jgi:hypothetical protein
VRSPGRPPQGAGCARMIFPYYNNNMCCVGRPGEGSGEEGEKVGAEGSNT